METEEKNQGVVNVNRNDLHSKLEILELEFTDSMQKCKLSLTGFPRKESEGVFSDASAVPTFYHNKRSPNNQTPHLGSFGGHLQFIIDGKNAKRVEWAIVDAVEKDVVVIGTFLHN